MKNKERDREILPRRIHTWTDVLGTKAKGKNRDGEARKTMTSHNRKTMCQAT